MRGHYRGYRGSNRVARYNSEGEIQLEKAYHDTAETKERGGDAGNATAAYLVEHNTRHADDLREDVGMHSQQFGH